MTETFDGRTEYGEDELLASGDYEAPSFAGGV